MEKHNLMLLKDGYLDKYDPNVNPSVATGFTTAGFRYDNLSAHHAVSTLRYTTSYRKINWVFEADLKNFFAYMKAKREISHLAALAADPEVRLDFATIDPGAVNYADFDADAKALGWDYVLSVSHAEARYFFELSDRLGIRYSYTVRELGQVRHVLAYRALGWISDPLLFKLTMSERHAWGVAPSREAIASFTRLAVPADVPARWMLYIEGDCHADLARFAVESGAHVRTGIGDNPRFDGEVLRNAEQVERIVEMARSIGREVADAATARKLLTQPPQEARWTSM